jgi:hypothetical protein
MMPRAAVLGGGETGMAAPGSVEEYLAGLPEASRANLEKLDTLLDELI